MLKHIAIENFRGFKTFEADLGPVTAFLGPNSSGKTTVLQAVRVACELLRLALQSGFPPRVERQAATGEDWIVVTRAMPLQADALLPLMNWQALFRDQRAAEGDHFVLDLRFSDEDTIQALWVQVTVRSQNLRLEVQVRSASALAQIEGLSARSPRRSQLLTATLAADAPVAVFVPPFYGTVAAEEYRARAAVDQRIGAGDQRQVVRNLVTALEPDQFDRLDPLLGALLNTSLTGRTSGDAIEREPLLEVRFRDNNGELELSAAGAGLVNMIAMYSALARWRREARERPVLFLLDEPEAHLSPRNQSEMASRMSRLVTVELGAQLLLATHSVDLLNRLSQEGARLLRCDRQATPSVTSLDSDASLFDDLGGWADLTPYTAINFLASRRVLFVEGADELAVLPLLGALRFRNDPGALRRFRQWAIVELQGARNAPMAALLARLMQNDAVRASARHGGFEAMVVLDRDYEREPGTTTTEDKGVRQTTIIWSVHSLESLLVAPGVLSRWLRAWLGSRAPTDLDARVAAAIDAANRDQELNDDAIQRYASAALLSRMRDGASLSAAHGQAVRDVTAEAQRRIREDPAVWQHGKLRAQFILGALRVGLDGAAQLPTDIIRLVERTDPNRIGLSIEAIPPEVNALLERMARP